MHIAHPP